ncbi:hypothetical protein GCM10020331_024980 [Ectobacillus funiculus]
MQCAKYTCRFSGILASDEIYLAIKKNRPSAIFDEAGNLKGATKMKKEAIILDISSYRVCYTWSRYIHLPSVR